MTTYQKLFNGIDICKKTDNNSYLIGFSSENWLLEIVTNPNCVEVIDAYYG